MSAEMRRLREVVMTTVLDGPGTTPAVTRRAAAANEGLDPPRRAFVDKVTKKAFEVTGEDVAALTAAGLAEDEIFELAVCAAIGESTRQLDAAMAALDEATAARAGS